MSPLLFTCSSSSHLTPSILKQTHLDPGKYSLGRFADGEVSFYLKEPIKGKICFVLGSTESPAENFLELLTVINTLKLNKAKKIITIIPYLGYSRSDKIKPFQPINAKLFLKILSDAGTNQFITLSLHSQPVEKFVPRRNLHLSPTVLFAEQINKLKLKNFTIATPDLGGTLRAQSVAKALGLKDITIVEKHRPQDDTTEVTRICGDNLIDKDVVFIDDMIQTGHTLLNAAKAVKKLGANKIYVFSTHCIYQAKGIKLLSSTSLFSKIFITNSLSKQYNLSSKVSILDISSLISQATNSITS